MADTVVKVAFSMILEKLFYRLEFVNSNHVPSRLRLLPLDILLLQCT